jgi:hypothetical protein
MSAIRRAKARRLRKHPSRYFVEMFHLELDIFEIRVSDEIMVFKTDIVFAPSFRKAGLAFTDWINSNFPGN